MAEFNLHRRLNLFASYGFRFPFEYHITNCAEKMNALGISCLIVVYFCYLLIGAAVFWAIEFRNEEERCLRTIAELEQYNITAKEGNVTISNLKNLVQVLLTANSNSVQFDQQLRLSCAQNWDFPHAFFFAGTVVTTIGYGNISPSTYGGRIFCIFFAAFGLPIFGVMFGEIGDKFAGVFKKLSGKVKTKAGYKQLPKSIVLLLVVGSLLVFCLLFPSLIFMGIEGWTYDEAFYYSFITLTTIGFGDFVVGANPDKEYSSIYRFAVYMWILFGLAFMAAIINAFGDLIFRREVNSKQMNETEESNEKNDLQNKTEKKQFEGLENKALYYVKSNEVIKREKPKSIKKLKLQVQIGTDGLANTESISI